MLQKITRVISLCVLISLAFSFPIFKGQGQQRSRTSGSEITFLGKEETLWTEQRAIPIPVLIGQGVKEEPKMESFDLGEETIGPIKKVSPSVTQPGCAYRSKWTRGIARAMVGDKALYEKGRYQYLRGDFEDAIQTFQKLAQEYPDSVWSG